MFFVDEYIILFKGIICGVQGYMQYAFAFHRIQCFSIFFHSLPLDHRSPLRYLITNANLSTSFENLWPDIILNK